MDHSTFSHSVNHFRGRYMSIYNDPRPGRPRTSTNERTVALVSDALEEDRRATCEELSRATGAKTLQEMHKIRPQLLMAGPLILHDNAHQHVADVQECSRARVHQSTTLVFFSVGLHRNCLNFSLFLTNLVTFRIFLEFVN